MTLRLIKTITQKVLPIGSIALFSGIIFRVATFAKPPPTLVARPKVLIDGSKIYKTVSSETDPRKLAESLNVELLPADRITLSVVDSNFIRYGIGERITIERAPRITLVVGGQSREVASWAMSVAELLGEQGLVLQNQDYVNPDQSTILVSRMTVVLRRVHEFDETKREVTKFKTTVSYENIIGTSKCETRTVQAGQDGIKEVHYLVKTEDGKEVKRQPVRTDVIAQLKNSTVVKTRMISPDVYSGRAKFGRFYPGYTAAYNNAPKGARVLMTGPTGKQVIITVLGSGPFEGSLTDLSIPAFEAIGGVAFQGILNGVKAQRVLCEA